MKKVHHLLVIAMLLVVGACKKDKNESARMDLITTGTWKLVALTQSPGHDIDGDGTIDTDVFVFYDDCEKDNFYVFKRNGDYVGNEGATKCDPSDPQAATTHWQFSDNETKIIIDGDIGTIEELSSSLLVISGTAQGETYTFTYGR